MKQLTLAIATPPPPDFDSFVDAGGAGAARHLTALTAPDRPGAAPVYLWGPAGSGKSHLLRALVRRWAASGIEAALFDASTPLPWRIGAACRLVVVDGCDDLDAERQHAAFTLFVEAATRPLQIVAAARVPPVDLAVRDDLRTRLGWGPVYAVAPLSEAQTRSVLQRDAERRGFALADDVVDYLLRRFDRDLGHLTRMLDRLDDYALARGRRVGVVLLREMLAEDAALAADDAGDRP